MVIIGILLVTLNFIKCFFARKSYTISTPTFYCSTIVSTYSFSILLVIMITNVFISFFSGTRSLSCRCPVSVPAHLLKNARKQISLNKIIAIMGFCHYIMHIFQNWSNNGWTTFCRNHLQSYLRRMDEISYKIFVRRLRKVLPAGDVLGI